MTESMTTLKLVRDVPKGGSIPPAVSAKVRKVVRERDLSFEAAEAKLELAEAQARDINERIEKIQQSYEK